MGARFLRNKTFSEIRNKSKEKDQNSRKRYKPQEKRNKTQEKRNKLKKKGTNLKKKGTKLTTLQAKGGSCPPPCNRPWYPDMLLSRSRYNCLPDPDNFAKGSGWSCLIYWYCFIRILYALRIRTHFSPDWDYVGSYSASIERLYVVT